MKPTTDDDPCMKNQEIYCKVSHLPVFASSGCNHINEWHSSPRVYEAPTGNLTDMMIWRYKTLDEALRISASYLITSCPVCNRAWDD